MKKTILSLAIAIGALVGLTSKADAGPRFSFSIGSGHSGHCSSHFHNRGRPHINSYVGHNFRSHGHCYSPRKISTQVICRRRICKTAYTSCGRPYTYHVTVVTYRDFYSNGTSRIYARTLSY
jgi:hypothetical protein